MWDEDTADDTRRTAEIRDTTLARTAAHQYLRLGMANFSFNKPEGACPTCTGLGVVYAANLSLLIDPARSIPNGGVVRWVPQEITRHLETLQLAAKHFGFAFDPATPIGEFTQAQRDLLLYGVHSREFRRHYPDIEPPQNVNRGRFEGIVPTLMRRYEEHAQDADYRERIEQLMLTADLPRLPGQPPAPGKPPGDDCRVEHYRRIANTIYGLANVGGRGCPKSYRRGKRHYPANYRRPERTHPPPGGCGGRLFDDGAFFPYPVGG